MIRTLITLILALKSCGPQPKVELLVQEGFDGTWVGFNRASYSYYPFQIIYSASKVDFPYVWPVSKEKTK